MLKKLFLLFILIIFISSGCTKKNNLDVYKSIIEKNKMVVGISFDSKPFGFKDSNGQIKGLEVDLAREISKRILGAENKVSFKNITLQDRMHAAMSGDVDMVISTMTINRQRKKLVDFSVPYFIAGQAICVRKDSKIDSLEDLLNKKIIVILGTTGEKNIRRFAPNALVQSYINNSDAINAFKNGFGDAITTDDSLLQGLVMGNSEYVILPKRLTKEPYGIAFRKSKLTKSLKNSVNGVLNEIIDDGTLTTIKDKWGIN